MTHVKVEQEYTKTNATGAAAIAASAAVPAGGRRRVVSVSAKLSAAPTSAGSLTITLNANAGAAYDTVLKSQDMIGVTSLIWTPDREIILEGGDSLDVAYVNTDTRTYGVQITLEVV